MGISCIYAIINLVNDKHYVGQTVDKNKRFKEHLKCLKGNYHCNKHLQRSWIAYGNDSFIFIILEKCLHSLLNEREQYWIDTLNPEYNLAPVAGSMLNYKHTEQARLNMSKAHKGKIFSLETKLKMSNAKIGNTVNIGRSQVVQINAMREAVKGKSKSSEHRAKIAAGNKGKIVSEETKKKMSEAAKRRWNAIDKNLKINFIENNPSLSG